MRGARIAYRYAKSLLNLAVEQGKLEEVHADMQLVADACKESHDLSILLKSPIVNTDKKEVILRAIFEKKIGKISMTFIDIINHKKREFHLEQIANGFLSQYKLHKDITTVVLTSAVALSKEAKAKIMAHVEATAKGAVQLEEKIDPALIGGFVLRIGDDQFDSSIQHKLNNLKKTFSENPYVPEL